MKAYAGSRSGIKLAAIPHADMWYFVEDRNDGFRIFREPRCIFKLDTVQIDQRDAVSVAEKIDKLYESYPLSRDGSMPDECRDLMHEILLYTMQTFGHYFEVNESKHRS